MGTLVCVSCRKIIDAEPPRCPACGAAQSDSDAGRYLRLAEMVGAFVAAAWVGAAAGYRAGARPAAVSSSAGPIQFRQRAQAIEEKNAAAKKAVSEWAATLQRDSAYPFATLEDVAVEPAKHAGRAESTLAMVSSCDPVRRRVEIGTGWGVGARFRADVGGLSVDGQKALLRVCTSPNWSVFKGRWRSEAGSLVLVVAESRVIQPEASIKTLAELLR